MAKSKEPDLKSMSDDELMDAWTATGKEYGDLRAKLDAFSEEHQTRERKKQMAHLANMSDADMALLQEVRAEGIASAEAAGTPGGSE